MSLINSISALLNLKKTNKTVVNIKISTASFEQIKINIGLGYDWMKNWDIIGKTSDMIVIVVMIIKLALSLPLSFSSSLRRWSLFCYITQSIFQL